MTSARRKNDLPSELMTVDEFLAYAAIPSVREILVVHSTRVEAQLLRRLPYGTWPADPSRIAADANMVLESIGQRWRRDGRVQSQVNGCTMHDDHLARDVDAASRLQGSFCRAHSSYAQVKFRPSILTNTASNRSRNFSGASHFRCYR